MADLALHQADGAGLNLIGIAPESIAQGTHLDRITELGGSAVSLESNARPDQGTQNSWIFDWYESWYESCSAELVARFTWKLAEEANSMH